MDSNDTFDLKDFMPYLLNQAAETSSRDFEAYYKSKYAMLRTEWRVIYHLGRYGEMTAKDICERARVHKTKVSRAVRALEDKRYLNRKRMSTDRRNEALALTPLGDKIFADLNAEAKRFDAQLLADFSEADKAAMRQLLNRIAQL